MWYDPPMRLIDQGLDAIIQNQPDLGGLALGGAIAAGLAALGWATVGWVDRDSKDGNPDGPWNIFSYTTGDDGQPYKFETEGQALDWAIANRHPDPDLVAVVLTESGSGYGPEMPASDYLNAGWTREQARAARAAEVRQWLAKSYDDGEIAAKADAAIRFQEQQRQLDESQSLWGIIARLDAKDRKALDDRARDIG